MTRRRLKDAVSIGSILEDFFQREGKKQALLRHRVVDVWPTIMDPVIVRHARAEKLDGAVLHIVTDSSVWMNELAAIKAVILEKINAHLDPAAEPITDIRFHQRSNLPTLLQPPRDPQPPDLTESDRRAIRQALEPVTDGELRRILQRILERDRSLKHRRPVQV